MCWMVLSLHKARHGVLPAECACPYRDAVGGPVPSQVVVLPQAAEARHHAALRLVGDGGLQGLGEAHVAAELGH